MSQPAGTAKTLREAIKLGICLRPTKGAPIEEMVVRMTKDFLRQRFAAAVLNAGLAKQAGQVLDPEKLLMDLIAQIERE